VIPEGRARGKEGREFIWGSLLYRAENGLLASVKVM